MRTLLFVIVCVCSTSVFAQQVDLKDSRQPSTTSLNVSGIKSSAAIDVAWDRMIATFETQELHRDARPHRIAVPIKEGKRITEERSLNVSIQITEQAIGAIVNISIQVVPSFSGIGLVNRPVHSFSYAQAVEVVTKESIEETLRIAGEELLKQESFVVVENAH